MPMPQQLRPAWMQLVLGLVLLAWSAQGLQPAPSRSDINQQDTRLPIAPPKYPKAPGDSKPRCYRAACSARLPRNSYGLPKVIHQTVADRRRAPCAAVAHMQTWLLRNPDYHYWLHDDQDCRRLVQYNFPYLLEYYDSLLTPVERSDLWRYLVLYVHGGVYADIDVSCELPLDAWDAAYGSLHHTSHPDTPRVWVGLESNYTNLARAYETKHMFPLQMTQWTIAATPGHPLLGSMGLRSMAEAARQFLLLNRYVAAATPQDVAPANKQRPHRPQRAHLQQRLKAMGGAGSGAAGASKPAQPQQAALQASAAVVGQPGQQVKAAGSTGKPESVWHSQQEHQHPHQQEHQHPHQQEQHPHQQEQQPHQQEQHPHQQEQHPHQQEHQHPHQQEQHPHQQEQHPHQQGQHPQAHHVKQHPGTPSKANHLLNTVVTDDTSQAADAEEYTVVRRLQQAVEAGAAPTYSAAGQATAMDAAAAAAAGAGTTGQETASMASSGHALAAGGGVTGVDTSAGRGAAATHTRPDHPAAAAAAAAAGAAPGNSSSGVNNVMSLLPGLFQPSLVPTATGVSFDYQGTILNRTGPFLWTKAVLEYMVGVAGQEGEGDTWGPLVAGSAAASPSRAAVEEDWEEGEGAAGTGLAQPSAVQQHLLQKHVRKQGGAATWAQPSPEHHRRLHQQQQQQPVGIASSQEWLQLLQAAGAASTHSSRMPALQEHSHHPHQQQQQQHCSGWVAALMPRAACRARQEALQLQAQWQQMQQQSALFATAADVLRQLQRQAPGAGPGGAQTEPRGSARALTTARAFIGYHTDAEERTDLQQQQQQLQQQQLQREEGGVAAVTAAPAPADDATLGATGSVEAAAVGAATTATPAAETPSAAAVATGVGAALAGPSAAAGGLSQGTQQAASHAAGGAGGSHPQQGGPPVHAAPAPSDDGADALNHQDAAAVAHTQQLVFGAWVGDLKLLPINAFAAGQPDSAWTAGLPDKELVRHHFMGSWKKHLKRSWQQPASVEMHTVMGSEEGDALEAAAAAGGEDQQQQQHEQHEPGAEGQVDQGHTQPDHAVTSSSSDSGYRRMLRQFGMQRPGGFMGGAGMGTGMGMRAGMGHNPFVSRQYNNPGLAAATMWARQNGVAVNTHPWAVWRPMVSNGGGGITMQANMRVAAGWTLLQRLAVLGEGRRTRRVCVWGEQWE